MQKNTQSQEEKRNEFIIAGKPDYLYLGRIVSEVDSIDEVTLKTIRKYLSSTEYIVLKLKCLGFEERERKIVYVDGKERKLEVIVIRLEKIPALKAMRERLMGER